MITRVSPYNPQSKSSLRECKPSAPFETVKQNTEQFDNLLMSLPPYLLDFLFLPLPLLISLPSTNSLFISFPATTFIYPSFHYLFISLFIVCFSPWSHFLSSGINLPSYRLLCTKAHISDDIRPNTQVSIRKWKLLGKIQKLMC